MGSKLDKVIVYGSYARGDYNEHSDVDIIILTTLTDEEIEKTETLIFDLAFDYQMEYGVDISVVVKNKDQFEYWLGALPFYNNIQKEGIVLMQYQYLEQLREKSDYDDFYIASKAQAEEQYNTAKYTLEQVSQYLSKNNTDESKE